MSAFGAPPVETVTEYSFQPGDLRVSERLPGVSGFTRTRNGADFIEATIRMHIDALDELVVVYNQCTDATPDILARLARDYAPKLKVYHYTDRVYPPGSAEHEKAPPDSPHSVVNYSNFALSRTTRAIVTKVDDDHLAMPGRMKSLADQARRSADMDRVMYCYSGVNLTRGADGALALPAEDLLCGNGDHWFLRVATGTHFVHDKRYETLSYPGLRREFSAFAYWHLKYLKSGGGFANYELERNPRGRFARKRARISAS